LLDKFIEVIAELFGYLELEVCVGAIEVVIAIAKIARMPSEFCVLFFVGFAIATTGSRVDNDPAAFQIAIAISRYLFAR
jgi:hypothetical protein